MRGKVFAFDLTFRKHVTANIDSMVNRAELMACKIEREQVCYVDHLSETQLMLDHTGGQ
jgi:hypothetical protein